MKEGIVLPRDLPPLTGVPRLEVPPIVATRLPNGLEVRVARREGVPLAAVRLVVRGGRSDDAPGRPGFADLLAAALKEGSSLRGGAALADALQGAGSELSASVDEDALALAAVALADRVDVVLEAMGEIVASPGFRDSDVARVKALAGEELATRESEPDFVAERALRHALYGDHPYAAAAPTTPTVDAVSPEALRAAARARLTPARAILFAVGAVDPREISEMAASAFAGWVGNAPERPEPPPAPRRGPGLAITVVPRPGSVQTTLLLGTIAPPRTTPDAAALVLANAVFGGAFSSRLVENLREDKGYTYSPGSRLRFRRLGGPFVIHASVRNEVTGAALNEILYELRRMATTDPTDEELERARNRETGALASALQTNAGLALELGRLAVDGLPAEALAALVDGFARCTAASLREAAARHFAGAGIAAVAVGDHETIRRELAPFGAELLEGPP